MSSSPRAEVARRALDWLRGWTLRSRLVAGLVALLAIVLLGIGTVSTLAVRDFLTRQLDGSLGAAAGLAEDQVHRYERGGPPPGADPFQIGQGLGTVTVTVWPGGSGGTGYRLTDDPVDRVRLL